MGAIKDVVELMSQLANRVQDRKLAAELNNIQSLVLSIQAEQAALHESNTDLREERLTLKERIKKLEAQLAETTSASVVGPIGVPKCPNCSTPSKPIFMSSLSSEFKTILNATHRCPQCKLMIKCVEQ